jgi:hypothetical protein
VIRRDEWNSKLPESVREQPACENCKHCIIRRACDSPVLYFCGIGAGPYPLVKSDSFNDEDKWWSEEQAQLSWEDGRQTRAGDVCDNYEKIVEEPK